MSARLKVKQPEAPTQCAPFQYGPLHVGGDLLELVGCWGAYDLIKRQTA